MDNSHNDNQRERLITYLRLCNKDISLEELKFILEWQLMKLIQKLVVKQ